LMSPTALLALFGVVNCAAYSNTAAKNELRSSLS
jgi:hypothetical protein